MLGIQKTREKKGNRWSSLEVMGGRGVKEGSKEVSR